MQNKQKKTHILFTGPDPRNIGGVSMHIRRLMLLLKNEAEIDIIDEGRKRFKDSFNIRSLNLIRYYRLLFRADLVHIHSSVGLFRLFHIINCIILGKEFVFTIHGDWNRQTYKKYLRFLFPEAKAILVLNRHSLNELKAEVPNGNFLFTTPFLPPDMDHEPLLEEELLRKIEKIRAESAILVVSNAWRLVKFNGEDLYGLDICIDAMKLLKNGIRKFRLIFVVSDAAGSGDMLESARRKIIENGLENDVFIVEHSISFVRLLKEADVSIRATNTDGDALSIRESLWCGCPCIASDAVERPQGVLLFRNRDAHDLAQVMNRIKTGFSEKVDEEDYVTFYRRLYGIN